jgi:hypothetical protein
MGILTIPNTTSRVEDGRAMGRGENTVFENLGVESGGNVNTPDTT